MLHNPSCLYSLANLENYFLWTLRHGSSPPNFLGGAKIFIPKKLGGTEQNIKCEGELNLRGYLMFYGGLQT